MKNGFELDEGDGMYVDETGMLVMQQVRWIFYFKILFFPALRFLKV